MTSKVITLHPPKELLDKWGILAYVDAEERARILGLPHGETPKAIKRLEREVDLLRFPRKKKTKVTYSWYNPNKPKPIHKGEHDNEDDTSNDL